MAVKPSDILNRIPLPAGITPLNDNSNFPSHYSDFGFGGLRTVDNLTERDAIATVRRVEGMIVYVVDDDAYFRLSKGITNADWVEFTTGGGTGAGLTVIPFASADWVDTPTVDPTMLTITLSHNLNTIDLDVEWYDNTSNGAVFVPWRVDPADPTNKIIGCIPLNRSFSGLVRITSSVASGGGGTADVVRPFETTDWAENVPVTDYLFFEVTHGLTTNRPAIETYDTSSNEQLLETKIESNERIRLIVHRDDVFAGYVHIRG